MGVVAKQCNGCGSQGNISYSLTVLSDTCQGGQIQGGFALCYTTLGESRIAGGHVIFEKDKLLRRMG